MRAPGQGLCLVPFWVLSIVCYRAGTQSAGTGWVWLEDQGRSWPGSCLGSPLEGLGPNPPSAVDFSWFWSLCWVSKSLYVQESHPLLPDAESKSPWGSTKGWIASEPENDRMAPGRFTSEESSPCDFQRHDLRPAQQGKCPEHCHGGLRASTRADQISGFFFF